jgi:hypothetical protein
MLFFKKMLSYHVAGGKNPPADFFDAENGIELFKHTVS